MERQTESLPPRRNLVRDASLCSVDSPSLANTPAVVRSLVLWRAGASGTRPLGSACPLHRQSISSRKPRPTLALRPTLPSLDTLVLLRATILLPAGQDSLGLTAVAVDISFRAPPSRIVIFPLGYADCLVRSFRIRAAQSCADH